MDYNKEANEIVKLQESNAQTGLTEKEAKHRIEVYGKNEIKYKKEKPWYLVFMLQFISPLPIILMLAAILSVLTSKFLAPYKIDFIDFAVILIIVIANSIIATVEEMKARNSVKALGQMIAPKAVVKRDGKVYEINSVEVVPGDILVLEAGKFIPADLRIIECSNLQIDESPLTGESVPVDKTNSILQTPPSVLADMKNMAFSSTYITNGRAVGVVVATGSGSEIGKISARINNIKQNKTPLQGKLNNLSKWITILAVIIAVCVFVLMYFTGDNTSWPEFLITAITLAIAIIPESLPIIVSVVLALSSQKMAKKNVVVKNLQAVETLGSVNVICSDKTGTLTQNKMTIQKYFFLDHNYPAADFKYDKLNEHLFHYFSGLILCNDALHESDSIIGDPTEVALIDWTSKFNLHTVLYRQHYPRVDEIPFDSERKLMTTVNQIDDKQIIYVKGAIDQLLEKCAYYYQGGKIVPMDVHIKAKIQSLADENSRNALRVLGFAYKLKTEKCVKEEYESDLVFLGGIAMIDPPRDSAKISVAQAHAAGIRVIMITGDHKTTAYAIAHALDIAQSPNQVLSGDEINALTDQELVEKVKIVNVFARVNPEHKVRIVEALQSLGFIVSMTGDGVNDAPSLVRADIGVAMGITGTDVSKQAAKLILTDDNFASIINGVIEGRNVYQKIKNAICFILASNFAEVLIILITAAAAHISVLHAINVLWFNLVVESLLAIPLGMNANDPLLMNNKPRNKKESIFKNMIVPICSLTIFVTITLVGSYYLGRYGYGISDANEAVKAGSTLTFIVLINSPIWFILVIKVKNFKLEKTDGRIFANKILLIAMSAAFVLNVLIVWIPFINSDIFRINTSSNLWKLFLTGMGLMFVPAILEYGFQAFRRLIKF